MKRIIYLAVMILLFFGCAKEEHSTVMDVDGNVYKTRNYGGRWWMVENMRTTKTKNGDNIMVTTAEPIYSYTTPYGYTYQISKPKQNGYLYNYSAATKICPDGWHLPTMGDYEQLLEYIGSVDKYCYNGNSKAVAQALASKKGWKDSNIRGTPGDYGSSSFRGYDGFGEPRNILNNASGFNAPPVGYIYEEDVLLKTDDGYYACFWLADELDVNLASYFNISYNQDTVDSYWTDRCKGFSVRCVKN